ncbi:hypothetical protein TNCV_2818571 [Trichonephila clavipes]|nr:hypothetical protein TNCV_2818571 [Trichonephila clavipes]
MRARNYCAHHNTRDHWTLRCMNRCPDLEVCLKRDLQCLRPEASLVLIFRTNVAGMKGRVDLAQPINRTLDLWCGSTIHYHSILFGAAVAEWYRYRTVACFVTEARKLIVPQLSQTYAQAVKSSTLNNSTQTDENITKINCPPLKLLAPLSSKQRTNIPTAITTSSSAQTQLLSSLSSKESTISNPLPPTPMSVTKGKIKEQPSPLHRPRKDNKKIDLMSVKTTTNLKKKAAKKHIRKDCEGTKFPQ